MNLRLHGRSRPAGPSAGGIVRGKDAATRQKAFQFRKEFRATFGLEFVAQMIERAGRDRFGPAQVKQSLRRGVRCNIRLVESLGGVVVQGKKLEIATTFHGPSAVPV